jgi:chitin disaccharide deacetylase
LISSTTIMANTRGFEDACALVHQHNLHGKVGLHLNMTYGAPLTGAVAKCAALCDPKGDFRRPRRLLWLSRNETSALDDEFEAQLQACMHNGVEPSHFDSHHDMHTQLAVTPIVVRIALRRHVSAVRLAGNCVSVMEALRRPRLARRSLYGAIHNHRVRAAGLAKTRFFGTPAEIRRVLRRGPTDCELMVHARTANGGELIDESGECIHQRDPIPMDLRERVKDFIVWPRLTSYQDA